MFITISMTKGLSDGDVPKLQEFIREALSADKKPEGCLGVYLLRGFTPEEPSQSFAPPAQLATVGMWATRESFWQYVKSPERKSRNMRLDEKLRELGISPSFSYTLYESEEL